MFAPDFPFVIGVCAVNQPALTRVPGPLLVGALLVLVAWSLATSLLWRNTYPPVFEAYQALAPFVPPEEVGFVTARRGPDARFSHHALRFVLAPREIPVEGRPPRSRWLVVDGTGPLPGYELVRGEPGGVALLRRR